MFVMIVIVTRKISCEWSRHALLVIGFHFWKNARTTRSLTFTIRLVRKAPKKNMKDVRSHPVAYPSVMVMFFTKFHSLFWITTFGWTWTI